MRQQSEQTARTIAYSGLDQLANETGVSPDALIDVFRIERSFHRRIIAARSRQERRDLTQDMYAIVHPRLRSGRRTDAATWYDRIALLFRNELNGKSVIDLGCGDGSLLRAIGQTCQPKALMGIDIFPFQAQSDQPYEFLMSDVVSLDTVTPCDVLISSEVIEHIHREDISSHLRSIYHTLRPGGCLILLTPNRLWGPHDVTRVIDCSYSGQIRAQGSHLNEMTYCEILPLLRAHGFAKFRTVLPYAQHSALLRSIRVPPHVNRALESMAPLRRLTHHLNRFGFPLYRNPIILIGHKF